MKTLLIPLALIAMAATAFGLAGPVGSPTLGYRADIDEAAKKKVSQALEFMNKEMEFLEGSFINEYTNFTLAGTMENAASCIWLIKEVGIWTVDVTLKELGEEAETLRIAQNTGANTVNVTVNSSKRDFRREEFERFLVKKVSPDDTLKKIGSLLRSEVKDDPKQLGRELAKKDIASGKKRILSYGMRRIGDGKDEVSGLPAVSVAGCIVSTPLVEAVDAYNEVMRAAAK